MVVPLLSNHAGVFKIAAEPRHKLASYPGICTSRKRIQVSLSNWGLTIGKPEAILDRLSTQVIKDLKLGTVGQRYEWWHTERPKSTYHALAGADAASRQLYR